MFTGLIEATGRIERFDGTTTGRHLRVATRLAADLHPGDSVAVNGVCLTVTSCDAAGFSADVSRETLSVTSFAALDVGRTLNLERPVRADARMGGHFVLGHVDGVGRVAAFHPDGESFWLDVEVPERLEPLVISRGSIALDGMSLTVAKLVEHRVGIQIVPFTYAHTALGQTQVGDPVNIEVDVLGKYVARFLSVGHPAFAEAASLQP